jgi:hypothetical protein
MPENISYSFVVRIWLEPRELPDIAFEWRGMIQEVISGEIIYFRDFDEIITFVIRQLAKDRSELGRSEE